MKTLKTLLRILAWLLVLAGILLLILYFAQSVLMYPAQNLGGSNTEFLSRLHLVASRGLRSVDVPGPREGTTVRALWMENSQGVAPVVLWFHGREEDVTEISTVVTSLRDQGNHVLAMEYPGYGDNRDPLSETEILSRADACFDWLAKKEEVAPRSIIVGGYELGASVALLVGARKNASAVLALGVLPDMQTAVAGKLKGLPIGFILKDHFTVEPVLGDIPVPILFVHGTADTVVPLARLDAFLAVARRARVMEIEGADRSDLLSKISRERWDEIGSFLASGK